MMALFDEVAVHDDAVNLLLLLLMLLLLFFGLKLWSSPMSHKDRKLDLCGSNHHQKCQWFICIYKTVSIRIRVIFN